MITRDKEGYYIMIKGSIQEEDITIVNISAPNTGAPQYIFNLYAEYIMRNAGLEEAQDGIKIAGRNINNLNMQMTPPLWQKVKRN